jgi:hypothetical protein
VSQKFPDHGLHEQNKIRVYAHTDNDINLFESLRKSVCLAYTDFIVPPWFGEKAGETGASRPYGRSRRGNPASPVLRARCKNRLFILLSPADFICAETWLLATVGMPLATSFLNWVSECGRFTENHLPFA